MGDFFNLDNKFFQGLSKVVDCVILSVLWVFCCIPMATTFFLAWQSASVFGWILYWLTSFLAGPATTALYYAVNKVIRHGRSYLWKEYWHAFKSNFKQATAIWLILLAAGIVLGFDFWFFVSGQMSLNGAVRTAMTAVSGGLLLIYLFIITYVFPLQARFYNPVKRTLFNAFFMSVRHLFQTIGILATDLGIAAATYFGLFYFPQFAMLLFLFGMPLIAFVNSYFFTAIFRKYMPKEEEQEHTDATPLLGEEDEEMKEAIRNLKGK